MITLSNSDIRAAGGVLAALADKSAEYMQKILAGSIRPLSPQAIASLDRIIVHVDPHLDEYFAELLFRACLPPEKWRCDLIEQAVFSETDDLGCKHLWPSAAVLGVGSNYAGGTRPLFLFDEHVSGQSKVADSCSQIVAEQMLSAIPNSLLELLREVNVIDEYGGGHPQNLNNLIKTMHEVRFWFGQSVDDGTQIRDGLSPEWKRAVIDACLVAVVYCFENGIDLKLDPDRKRDALVASLENYIKNSPHVAHPRFQASVQRMRSIFNDQAMVFKNAVLQDRKGPIRDSGGNVIPQLLLISRICFACEHCWGPQLRDVIATHFWEGELQNHLHFAAVEEAIDAAIKDQKIRVVTPAGTITHNVLKEMEVMVADHRGGPKKPRRTKLWIMTMTPAAGVSRASQALQHYLNEHNYGCGLVLMKNATLGTSALFKGSSLPDAKWQKLVKLITSKEAECWHVIHQSTGTIAPFIVNGNKTHQYVPRSALDSATLVELAKRTLY
jgi:hypothetical protein